MIVGGPAIVIRPEWSEFRNPIKPRGFYLVMDAAGVLEALNRCYADEAKWIGQHPSFQSWNEGVTTEYNARNQRWERVGYEKALENIRRQMANNLPLYEAAAESGDRFLGSEALRQNRTAKAELVARIRSHLGL